ncbi:MAG: hypothetical protein GY761_17160, partial [Hyphomicrobiales bacterium]|nr:hypothetical protein [Hyphomicrobiales bacterium]
LAHGWSGGWNWTCDGERVAWIRLHANDNRLHLSYRVRIAGGDWEDIDETIQIVQVPCSFGGSRPYFICPGIVNGTTCARRVVKLYGSGWYFLCRHCYQLTYTSQSEEGWDRALRKANKIRQRLGGEAGMAELFPNRPKGMWQRTYEKLRNQSIEAEAIADEAFLINAERLLTGIDDSNQKRDFW